MSVKKENLIKVRPAADKNSVERMSLIFEWAEPLSNQTMLELSALCESLGSEFPRKIELRSADSQPESNNSDSRSDASEDSELAAIIIDDNEDINAPPDSKKAELIIARKHLFFSIHAAYPGWQETKEKAYKNCRNLLERIRGERELSGLGLQVINGFYLEEFDGDFSKILRTNCPHLPPSIFARKSFWHVEEGFFSEPDHQSQERLLTNMKMAYFPEGADHKLLITTLHRMDFNAEKKSALTASDLWGSFEILHPKNKSLIHSILHEDVCTSIGLELPGDVR